MNKNLDTTNQNAKSLLIKTKSLLNTTKNVLSGNNHKTWKDKDTNLVWEIKSNKNIGEIYTYEDAIEYVVNLNKIYYGGYNNWEIPIIKDLESLVSEEFNHGLYIKKELSKNSDWAYWTLTSTKKDHYYVFYYNYGEKRLEHKNFKCYVRCVSRGNCE